ncbi:MAG: hypothetical protein IJK26_11380 [Clostridia bacterium]|nr:hypothetical protein [Clostridia bacterium]
MKATLGRLTVDISADLQARGIIWIRQRLKRFANLTTAKNIEIVLFGKNTQNKAKASSLNAMRLLSAMLFELGYSLYNILGLLFIK